MNIKTALYAAASGLRATQQQAAIVSHNIANATNDGFVRKGLALTTAITAGTGQGVTVEGVSRNVDELLIRDSRYEQSRYTSEEARASLLADYATAVGQPQDERSVSTVLSKLQQAFQQLHSAPASDSARAAVVTKANALVQSLQSTAASASTIKNDARDRLESTVVQVNADLVRISELNKQIASQQAKGADTSDLRDERDRMLDGVSEEIGIRTYTRDNGEVVVMTRNGQTLLDRELAPGATPLKLTGTNLQIGSYTVDLTDAAQANQDLQTGRLMGYTKVAYQDMPKVLDQLDELAANVIVQFQQAEANPAAAGLFTDGGSALAVPAPGVAPAYTAGLAGRIAVNTAVDGNAWRTQSGVQAAVPLAVGDQTQTDKYLAVFASPAAFAKTGMPGTATIGAAATTMVSTQQGYRTTAESDMKSLKISADTLKTARMNRDGVNTDDETQKLLLIEQSYGASAQVIQVAARMLDTLLTIGA
jgi:flagellar hook-associated protein 1